MPYDKDLAFFDHIPQEWTRFLTAIENAWWKLRGELKDRDASGIRVKEIRFPKMSSDQMFNFVLAGPDANSQISNARFTSEKELPKTITPDTSAIFGFIPPSGNP